jgi:TolB-like protein/DNA-binding winged helix-turn-helix (wHTH) protein/tetratricopeptide (TPR) repeat protein
VSAQIFRFDHWTLNLQSGELHRGGARTRLQEHPLQVLASLLENPGEVVTREQLIARLWPSSVVDFDMGLNTAVRKLRAALGDTADTPRYIETLPRRGYRFIASVDGSDGPPPEQSASAVAESASELAAPAFAPESRDARQSSLAQPATVAVATGPAVRVAAPAATAGGATVASPFVSPRGRAFLRIVVLAVLVLAAGVLAWLLRGGAFHASLSTDTSPAASVPAFAPPAHSVAVLPFVNMSGDVSQDYFSDGLSEELLNALSRIGEIQVAAQTSSFYFKGKSVELTTIAHRLNVATVLEGSVRRSGRTVRITAQLINAVTGFHVWSQTYDRNLDDVLTVQSEIANAVATALKVTLLGDATTTAGLGGTRNALALDAYLRGLKLSTATVRSGEEARETIAAFTEAIRLDPNFALAYTGRARALVDYGSYFLIEATRDVFSKAKADAARAVTLEPNLGEAHAALGQAVEIGFRDFTQAAAEYERAMTLAAGDARVLRAYSNFAAVLGHNDVAIATARRSVELDPLNVLAHRVLGNALENARHYAEAIEAFEHAIKLNPNHATEAYQRRGRLYYLIGNFQLARASCEAEPDVYHRQACMPLVYEKLGQHEAAQAALAAAMAAQGDYGSYQYAQIYAQWGKTKEALDWLETGLRVFDPGVECVKTDAFLDPLRGEPRFQAIVRALEYPP